MIKNIKKNYGKIIINGKEYAGENISIVNNKVMIDGKECPNLEEKEIHININGNIEQLTADSCAEIVIYGNAISVETVSGNVECNVIEGNVSTMSGDVVAKEIHGQVSTMSGDIIEK